MSDRQGEALLTARGLAKSYGARCRRLRGVDLDAHEGELIAVIGPNGAGKTTLLSILAGAQPPSMGTVAVKGAAGRGAAGKGAGGRGAAGRGAEGKSAAGRVADHVGWVPQQPAVYARLSVAENLELFARLEGVPDPSAVVRAMLEQTGLRERAGERVERLSGGNRQRVNIALGLLADPKVLILDEPSSSLDPRQRERLWHFILDLAGRGRCVVFSTHNVAEAERYASLVLVLADGECLFSGSPAQLARSAAADGEDADGERGFEGAFVEFLRERGH